MKLGRFRELTKDLSDDTEIIVSIRDHNYATAFVQVAEMVKSGHNEYEPVYDNVGIPESNIPKGDMIKCILIE